jgi:uncharacterized membrane protein YqjE
MPDRRPSGEADGLGAAFQNLAEGLSSLVRDHVAWLRLELQREASEAGRRSGQLVLFAGIALVGYVWLNLTLVLLVGTVMGALFGPVTGLLGMSIAMGLLGFVHVGFGLYRAHDHLEALQDQRRRLLDMTDPLIESESWPPETTETTENSSPETTNAPSPSDDPS